MNYIVLDMEWNQSYPRVVSSDGKKKTKPKNEIIEIGAIMLNEKLECIDTFKELVKPVYIKKLNDHVRKLTGITPEMLKDGTYFPEVVWDFRDWCGDEDRVILTWGYDDIPMLLSCLKMYGLESDWVGKWYNLQVIFNAQTDGGKNQRSLASALEYFNCSVDEERPQHDALNDAAYTAMICRRLDLERGIREYAARTVSSTAAVFLNLKEVARKQFRCDQSAGRYSPEAFNVNPCPVCGAPMVRGKWVRQGRGKMITIGECREHGRFFMQNRIIKGKTDKYIRKVVYESNPEAESYYAAKAQTENTEPES